jgi:hypothetical protein
MMGATADKRAPVIRLRARFRDPFQIPVKASDRLSA